MKLIVRPTAPRASFVLEQTGVHPLLARLYAARGVQNRAELDDALAQLLPPTSLKGIDDAAALLADAIARQRHLCVVADYDCDGATACAVALRGLRALGAQRVSYVVPDRVRDGYGLTPPIADRVQALGAEVLITVDNGIASFEGVAHARRLGLDVLVTDHHLPAADGLLPAAQAIVNPNQPGCLFDSKALAGVGVMFYVLLALRSLLRSRGSFTAQTQPRLDDLLPLVALGTVADVVRLDANNRRLVAQGLKRVRAGAMPAGMRALFDTTGRDPTVATSMDFGFALGPRINAAGRLADMTLGIACLLTDEAARATELAQALDAINRERRDLEADMREQALERAAQLLTPDATTDAPAALCVSDVSFHEGVVGIVASRLKDQWHRPCFVFAPSQADGHGGTEWKGSGRSIAGFHLRDALDLVAKRHPGAILRFGGHAMAACTVHADQLPVFSAALARVAAEWLDAATLQRRLDTDGPLEPAYRRLDVADLLQREVWGQGFAPPLFSEELDVVSQRLVGSGHSALKLRHHGEVVDAMWFGRTAPLPARAHLAYRLDADAWNGVRRLRFMVEGMEE
jgi:single-stranded-DNA-specific exonuclease